MAFLAAIFWPITIPLFAIMIAPTKHQRAIESRRREAEKLQKAQEELKEIERLKKEYDL